MPLEIRLRTFEGTASERAFVEEVVDLLRDVVNSNAFRERVEGFSRYRHHGGLYPSQI